MKRYFFNCLLVFLLPLSSKADQLIYVNKEQAERAKEIILSKKELILACTCCSDTNKIYIKVTDAEVVERNKLFSVEVKGTTQYSKRYSGFVDLAYCYTKTKNQSESIATDLIFSSQKLSAGCFRSFKWWFPENNSKYWNNISNGEVNVLSQQIPIHLDSSNLVNFMIEPSAAYLGMHVDTAKVLVDPISLNIELVYHEKEVAVCNYIVKIPYNQLAYYSSSSDNPLPVALIVNGEHFEIESASITFSNEEGDVRELSTLSPYYFARFNKFLEGIPLQEEWMRNSLFPENYPQGMIKVDEAKFSSPSNSSQIAVLRDFCIVPLKFTEE
jgi:hypothetical protein